MLLRPGTNCWRVESAHRLGLFIDIESCAIAAREAMRRARRSIWILGWEFDPDILFVPDDGGDGPSLGRLGPFLKNLALRTPDLDVRILCWDAALPVAASQTFFPHRARRCFRDSPVQFVLDGATPLGACHHQKALVVDDTFAIVGGADVGAGRWDTARHLDDDPKRRKRPGKEARFDSRHELMAAVDGPAAAALGALFRDRWARAEPKPLSRGAPAAQPDSGSFARDLWPSTLPVAARNVRVGLARSAPRWRGETEIREVERLHLASIRSARRLIYMENQYFTSPIIAAALASRLSEAEGPEVVLVTTLHSPSYFDRATMDSTREGFFSTVALADRHRRLSVLTPLTEQGRVIIVHAKLAIIDNELLRIGSANLNNRSMAFDTECDLLVEADGSADADAVRRAIAAYRLALLAHWIHQPEPIVMEELTRTGSVRSTIEALDRPERRMLGALKPKTLGRVARLIGRHHIGDPVGAGDNWRPWRRRDALADRMRALEREGSAATDLTTSL